MSEQVQAPSREDWARLLLTVGGVIFAGAGGLVAVDDPQSGLPALSVGLVFVAGAAVLTIEERRGDSDV